MDNHGTSEEDKIKAKKRLTVFIAGTVTFIIFCGWIFYFVGMAKGGLAKWNNPFALFSDLKENTSNAWDEMGKNFESATTATSSDESYTETASSTEASSTADTIATTTPDINE